MLPSPPIFTLFPYTTLFRSLFGSREYVKVHKAEMPKTSMALVHDTGTGKVQGIGLQGPSRSEEHTLNSSHVRISYAVFCLKKKKKIITENKRTTISRLIEHN